MAKNDQQFSGLIVCLVLSLFLSACGEEEKSAKKPPLTLQKSFDLGLIKAGEPKETTLDITNNSDKLVKLIRILTGCTCFSFDPPPREPLKPGETVKLSLKVSTLGVKGKQSQKVSILSDHPDMPRLETLVSFEAIETVSVIPPRIGMTANLNPRKHFNDGEKFKDKSRNVQLSGPFEQVENINSNGTDLIVNWKKGEAHFNLTLKGEKLSFGHLQYELKIKVKDLKEPLIVPVEAWLRRQYQVRPSTLQIKKPKNGKAFGFVRLYGMSRKDQPVSIAGPKWAKTRWSFNDKDIVIILEAKKPKNKKPISVGNILVKFKGEEVRNIPVTVHWD